MQGAISFILALFFLLSLSLTDANEFQSNTSTSKCKVRKKFRSRTSHIYLLSADWEVRLVKKKKTVFLTDYILGRFRLQIIKLEMSKTIKKNSKGVKDHQAINAGFACFAEGRSSEGK